MRMTKSPFKVYQEFLTPLECERIIKHLPLGVPDKILDTPIPTIGESDFVDKIVNRHVNKIIPELEKYYNFSYKATTPYEYTWYTQGTEGGFICNNSKRINQKWLRTLDRDFTGIIFLSDYNETEYFEEKFDCYGGKLEFPQHAFGFNPQRGTLVIFPSGPHFIQVTTPVKAGNLVQLTFHLAAMEPYLYNPREFPGDFSVWFTEV